MSQKINMSQTVLPRRFALVNGQLVLPHEVVSGKALIIDAGKIAGYNPAMNFLKAPKAGA